MESGAECLPLLMETYPFLLFVQLREGEEIQEMYELELLKIMFQHQSGLTHGPCLLIQGGQKKP